MKFFIKYVSINKKLFIRCSLNKLNLFYQLLLKQIISLFKPLINILLNYILFSINYLLVYDVYAFII